MRNITWGNKISQSLKGKKRKPRSEETKQKIRLGNLGKKRSEQAKINIGKSSKGRIFSEETKKKISESNKGKGNGRWKGGKVKELQMLRGLREYKIWRKAVLDRDNYTCQICGEKSQKGHHVDLHADHIKPFAYYPELRFDINNGRTLCVPCHRKTPTYGWKISVHYDVSIERLI